MQKKWLKQVQQELEQQLLKETLPLSFLTAWTHERIQFQWATMAMSLNLISLAPWMTLSSAKVSMAKLISKMKGLCWLSKTQSLSVSCLLNATCLDQTWTCYNFGFFFFRSNKESSVYVLVGWEWRKESYCDCFPTRWTAPWDNYQGHQILR